MRAALFFTCLLATSAAHADDVRGWIGAGGRNALGPAYSDFGVRARLGAPLAHDHVWLGGTAAIEGASVWSQASGDARFVGMLSLSALFQLRVFFFPSLLRSRAGVLEWDAVRFNAGLRLGVVLGAPVK